MPIKPDLGGTGGDFTGSGTSSSGSGGGSFGSSGSGSSGGSAITNIMRAHDIRSQGLSEGVFGIFGDGSNVVRGPAFSVAAGSTVQLMPQKSDGTQNSADVFFAIGPGNGAKNGNRVRLVNNSNPINVKVSKLSEIQVYGTVSGEGVAVVVLPPSGG